LFALFISVTAFSQATIYSNNTGGGDWTVGASWQGGVPPGSSDNVIIRAGDSIYNANTTVDGYFQIDGVLQLTGNLVFTGPYITGTGRVWGAGASQFRINNTTTVNLGANLYFYCPVRVTSAQMGL
jgi:hypothetical protein